MKSDAFRLDINGLRAWAVCAVVFFHFKIFGFNGGFVGVDIFFVISGYLMTGIIVDGLKKNSFSILDFYLARAKRIIPALLVLSIFLLVMGWWALGASDYKKLGYHTASSLLFLSNIAYWREQGYFDSASHEKWLLHTWSLSVEWQFYLILPVILALTWMLAKKTKYIYATIIMGALLSLLLSWSISEAKASASFFLLPTRIWQLLAGGIIYIIKTEHNRRVSFCCQKTEWVGFALISVSIVTFDSSVTWPSLLAVIPVAGAALVLIANNQQSFLTNNRVTQWIGNRSYSIYLWHWVVCVWLIYAERQENFSYVAIGILLSFTLGALSYEFIEKPSRVWLSGISKARSALYLVAGLIPATFFAIVVYHLEGVPDRLNNQVVVVEREIYNRDQRRDECHISSGDKFKACLYGGSNIRAIVIGDSHAASVVTAVQAALSSDGDGILAASYSSCPTIFGAKVSAFEKNKCDLFNKWIFEYQKKYSSELPLIIVGRTASSAFGPSNKLLGRQGVPSVFFDEMVNVADEKFLEKFKSEYIKTVCSYQQKRQVYLLRPIPEMGVDVPKKMIRKMMQGEPYEVTLNLSAYKKRQSFVWEIQDAASATCGVKILSTTDYLCPKEICKSQINGRPLYYDENHLSEFGNRLLVPMFSEIFK